jgi:hypothetical protein
MKQKKMFKQIDYNKIEGKTNLQTLAIISFIIIIIACLLGVVFGYFERDDSVDNNSHDGIPVQILASAILTAHSQSVTTPPFEINPNEIYLTNSLRTKAGIDSNSIYFVRGDFSKKDYPNLIVGITPNGKYSFLKFDSVEKSQLKLNALVVCRKTATELALELKSIKDSSDKIVDDPVTPEEYCKDAQPCCAIILTKIN